MTDKACKRQRCRASFDLTRISVIRVSVSVRLVSTADWSSKTAAACTMCRHYVVGWLLDIHVRRPIGWCTKDSGLVCVGVSRGNGDFTRCEILCTCMY